MKKYSLFIIVILILQNFNLWGIVEQPNWHDYSDAIQCIENLNPLVNPPKGSKVRLANRKYVTEEVARFCGQNKLDGEQIEQIVDTFSNKTISKSDYQDLKNPVSISEFAE